MNCRALSALSHNNPAYLLEEGYDIRTIRQLLGHRI